MKKILPMLLACLLVPSGITQAKGSSMVEYGQTWVEIVIANQVHALKTHGAMKIVFRTFLEGF